MNAEPQPIRVNGAVDAETSGPDPITTVLRLGSIVSGVQSALFVTIGVAALVLGVDRLVDDGFAALAGTDPTAFRVFCAAFVLIAVLGLAITGAERALIEPANAGLARYGAVLAYLGHAGTIAFFSWWLFHVPGDRGEIDLDVLAPIGWGVMFELVFVGAWVWIIAAVMYRRPSFPPAFVAFSVVKAASFWFAFVAILTDENWLIAIGVGAVTFVTGPIWHGWIPRLFQRYARERADGR